MVSNSNNFTSWVYEQMYELPTSSLRQFYRKRVNPKNDVGYAAGTTASRPCEMYSRWRKYAITSKDTLDNRRQTFSRFSKLIMWLTWGMSGRLTTNSAPLLRRNLSCSASRRLKVLRFGTGAQTQSGGRVFSWVGCIVSENGIG